MFSECKTNINEMVNLLGVGQTVTLLNVYQYVVEMLQILHKLSGGRLLK